MEPLNEKFDENKRVTIESIAEQMIKAADRILRYHIDIALGFEPPENFEKGNTQFQDKIINFVKPMIDTYKQSKEIDANSSGTVITLLSKGKISPAEAISLLSVIKQRIQVEETEIVLQLKKDMIQAVDDEPDEELPGVEEIDPKDIPEGSDIEKEKEFADRHKKENK